MHLFDFVKSYKTVNPNQLDTKTKYIRNRNKAIQSFVHRFLKRNRWFCFNKHQKYRSVATQNCKRKDLQNLTNCTTDKHRKAGQPFYNRKSKLFVRLKLRGSQSRRRRPLQHNENLLADIFTK